MKRTNRCGTRVAWSAPAEAGADTAPADVKGMAKISSRVFYVNVLATTVPLGRAPRWSPREPRSPPMSGARQPRARRLSVLLAGAALVASLGLATSTTAVAAETTSVTLVGDLQSEV